MERSPEMILAMLAILRVGAAYVPLDSEYPPERITFMVEDAQLKAILSHQPCFSGLRDNGIEAWSSKPF